MGNDIETTEVLQFALVYIASNNSIQRYNIILKFHLLPIFLYTTEFRKSTRLCFEMGNSTPLT